MQPEATGSPEGSERQVPRSGSPFAPNPPAPSPPEEREKPEERDASNGSPSPPSPWAAEPPEDVDEEQRLRRIVREEVHNALVLGPRLLARLDAAPWAIDEILFEDDRIEIQGWALPPDDGYHPVTFCLNDEPFEDVRYPLFRDDIGQDFWYRERSLYNAFRCRTTIDRDRAFPDGIASFSFADRRTARPFVEHQRYYLLDPRRDTVAMPDAERRHRVHGNRYEASFRLQGASAFVKLDQAIQRAAGRGLRSFPRVLDWGSGCARVGRHFAPLEEVTLVSADIDHDNIRWCRENLGFGEYYEIGLDPPMPFEDESFDLAFGISVFTHLREPDQFAWLDELARVTKRGAYLLMTVQGNNALARAPVNVHQIKMLDQTGFLNTGRCTGMIETPDDLDYYVDVVHTHEYIRDRWSPHFEILEIVPAYIGNMQDLVIMRRRQA